MDVLTKVAKHQATDKDKEIPFRRIHATRVRLIPALFSSGAAAAVFLAFYYLTLGHLPRAFPGAYVNSPVGVWADRLDLAQFTGTFLHPPYPSILNWWIGFIAFGGLLTGLGVFYCFLLSWGTIVSGPEKGVGFGGALFGVVGVALWMAMGFHPGIMRNSIPDTGFALLGWSGWATLQMLFSWLLWGLVLGQLYSLFQYVGIVAEQGASG